MASRPVVIVTGSSGLIGSAAARRFGERFDTVGFDREGPPHPPPAADCVCVDVTSEQSVQEGVAAVRARHGDRLASVIHLAAYYDFSGEPSPRYEEITVRGTERLLRALKPLEIEQFVFSSTMLVHAPGAPGQRIDEEWPVEPKWDYPASKVKTEERIAGVYDDRCHSIPLAHQIQRIYERKLTSRVSPAPPRTGRRFCTSTIWSTRS